MAHYRRKADFKPPPCPVCNAPGVVTEWNELRLGSETSYIPVKTECSQQCWRTMPLEEWNKRNAEGLKRRDQTDS